MILCFFPFTRTSVRRPYGLRGVDYLHRSGPGGRVWSVRGSLGSVPGREGCPDRVHRGRRTRQEVKHTGPRRTWKTEFPEVDAAPKVVVGSDDRVVTLCRLPWECSTTEVRRVTTLRGPMSRRVQTPVKEGPVNSYLLITTRLYCPDS